MFVFKPQIDTSSLAQDEAPASGFLETLEANTEILGSSFRNAGREEEAYDARNDAIFNRLGVKLDNPARVAQDPQLGQVDWRGQYDQRLKDLQQQYPDAADVIRADLSPATEAAQQTAAVQQRAADTAARYPYRLPDDIPLVGGQSIPSMVGGLVTGATDPFTAPTLLIAPTRVAEGAAGLLWAGLRSGAANAVGSAAEQPYIAAWKKQAGLEHTFSDALKEVAANAAFGFLADVGVRGLYRGGQVLAGRRPVLDNEGNVIGYRGASDPKADPLEALNDAAAAAPPGSILRKAAELDPDALREVARHTGLDADPAVRGALDALERDRADLVPPAGVMDDEHIAKANDAISAANDPKALPVGDAIIGGHGPEASPERLREVLGRDPIALAADIRETPEILAEGLPWTDPKLKAAANLSKLSDQAFDMVAGGEVDPRLGTLVAEHVADPDQHAPLLRQLSEAAPATPEAASAKLADLLAGPRDEPTHARVAGIPDELVDRPVTLVDDPYGADGLRQLEQLRRDLAPEIEAATGVKAAADGRRAEGVSSAAIKEGGDDPLRQLQANFDRAAAARAHLTEALDRAIGRLPDGVTAKSFGEIEDLPPQLARDVQSARSAGYRIEALTDRRSGNIWIAVDALNPDAILSHETIHSLRQVGLLTDNELKILANKFREVETQLSKYLPNAVSLAEYERLYRSLPPEQVRDAVMQEAAAHLYEARANGANFGKKANAILRKIKQFLERVKNALNGLGWQNAEDVMRAIDSGEIGRRGLPPASGTPNDPALKASVPATTAAPAVDDFSASVDALKNRFGVKTRQRDFGNNGSLFSLKEQQPLTLREEVEQLKSGSRLAVVARHLAAFGGDAEDILGVIQKASRVDVDAASVPELQRYIVSLEDLQQVIEDRVQHGYELGDDVDAIGELISGKLEEVSSRLSEISDQADRLASDIGDKFDALHERYETLLDERFGDDTAAREAYEESGGSAEFSSSVPAIQDAAGDPKPGETALEILGREADASAQYLSRYDVQAKALLDLNPETMDLPTVEAAMEKVSDVHGQLASVKRWAEMMADTAWHRSSDAVDQAEMIKDKALTPQLEKLENARDAIAEKVDAADEALQRKQGSDVLFALRAYHSTAAEFETFDPEFTDEVGFHFGTRQQARDRAYIKAGGNPFKYFRSRTIAVDVELKNPAVISRDIGRFDGATLARQLVEDRIAPGQLLRDIAGADPQQQTRYVRNWLIDNGYDGVRYINRYEGPGRSSVMTLGTGNVTDANTGQVLFSLRDDAQAQLKEDLAQVAQIADAKAKAQRERQALIDEKIRQQNERFVTTLRDARGQVDPAKALIYLLENHGQVDLPQGMTSVAAEQKAVEAMAKAGMEEVLHTFRPQLLTGKTRETARLTNMVREMAGEGTGDVAAKAMAQAVMRTNERLRQEFNAAGGDIPKLEGWFLPQVHDRGALLAAGREKWVEDIWKGLDTDRMLRTVRDEASPDTINAEARKLVATTEASKQVRDREIAQYDAEAKQARDEMKARHAGEKTALADDLEATRAEIRASREKELAQARSIRDQQKAVVKPAERAILSERFERARAEIERTTDRELSAADREHARLSRKWEAARQAEIEKLDKDAAKAREKLVSKADEDHATRVDDARVAHDHRLAQGEPITPERLREILGDIWENNTSDGHGTQAANANDPFGGITGDPTGAKKLSNQRQEHRFLHFKSADAWLDYQKQYGGGADPFRAAMQHITSISKDIAAMRVLGTNPNRELARLAKFAMKQAKLARPAAVLIDEAVSKVKELTAELLAQPSRLDEVTDRIGEIHKEIARIREKRIGPPSRRSKKKIEALRDELFKLDGERIDLVNNGKYKVGGNAAAAIQADLSDAFDELAAVQDVDKVLFPKRTEFLGKTMTQGGFWTTAPQDYANAYIERASAMWDLYRGVTSAPVNAQAASLMQMLRNVGVVGRGGSMVISSIADNFTQVMARRFVGLPIASTMTDILKHLGPNARREAQRQALIGETYLHMFNDGARGAASLHGPEWSHFLAERTIALQGLSRGTDAQRMGFGMSLQAGMADLAVKSWDEVGALNPRVLKLFQRYGLSASDWDAIRLDPTTGNVRDVDFLSPNLVRDSLEAAGRGNERIAERYLGMILQETDFASPTSMLRARAAMVGKTRPGTLVGEFLRTAGQFKQFSFMFMMLHFERALREGIANGTLKGASYAAQTLLVMTLGGALVVQLKDLKGGKDTRPMDKPGFWGAALMQGGGLGIVGDIFNSEQNRFGGGLVSTFAGPVFGLGEDILGAAGISPKTTAARGQARLATSYVPGSSLWYLNLAYQRTVADTLQRYVDPKAYDAFRRRQTQQLKDYGNGFWWAPGQRAPARAPRLN